MALRNIFHANGLGVKGILVAMVLLLLPPASARADAEAALQFLKLGKAAIDKRQYADAVTRLRKALEEDSTLIEAQYWLAVAFDKNGEKAEAIQAYRNFLERVELKGEMKVSKEETRLGEIGKKRLATLVFGEGEFQKLEEAFASELMKFARDSYLRDPASATKALQILLQFRSDHAGALALLKKLGVTGAESENGPSPVSSVPAPFQKVKSWQDLLAMKVFSVEQNKAWKYEEGLLIGDLEGGVVFNAMGLSDTGPAFAMEIEVRVVTEYERGWLAGPVFGHRKGAFLTAFFQKSLVTLLEQESASQKPLGEYDMPPVDLKAWHRLGVIVRGNAIEVWFDGKPVITFTHPSRSDFSGQIGIFHQRHKGEYRIIRIGNLD